MKIIKRVKTKYLLKDISNIKYLKITVSLNIDNNDLYISIEDYYFKHSIYSKYNSASIVIDNTYSDINNVFESEYVNDLYNQVVENFYRNKKKKLDEYKKLEKINKKYQKINLPKNIKHFHRKEILKKIFDSYK